jgi:uncharacterized protein YjiS (DUF1127 family)
MTMIPDDRYQFVAARLLTGVLAEMCLAAPHALVRMLRRQRDREHLYELPDHLLRDIGIDRVEIASIVRFGRVRML